MLRIGICENDPEQAEQLHNWIDEALFRRTELTITHFACGEEVVAAMEDGTFDSQLLLIEIPMKEQSGLNTAAYIREQNVDVDIIFLTSLKQYAYERYVYKAYACLLKSDGKAALKSVLNQYVDEWEGIGGSLDIYTSGGMRKLWLDKVVYFTSDVRVVEAHLLDGIVRFYGKLNEVQEQVLEMDFLRCHQSFLVNRRRIEKMTRSYLIVQGERIPVSRAYYERLRDKGLFQRDKGGKLAVYGRRSLIENDSGNGAVVGIAGKFTGVVIRIRPNEKIVFGRNHEMADFVLDEKSISRRHCWIQYNGATGEYYVYDCSANGVFVNETCYLDKGKIVILNKGDELRFADTDNVFKLG
ncbi:MAG: LytTR family transcriptional regulator DNA-binding domain-containing protein [Lachnospiraceae bacterium]|nr:LytTR family transcriptional regulator DNA-binding domain-containing protein [Lachnospiraceae bacterium]